MAQGEQRKRSIPRYDVATNTVRQVHRAVPGRGVARCGTFSENKTTDARDITCKRCIKYGE
jgi:hypothetical protein